MEETKEQQSLHGFLQFCIYLSVFLDVLIFVYSTKLFDHVNQHTFVLVRFLERMNRLVIYQHPLYSKLFTFILICLVAIGTLSKKKKDLNPKTAIIYPLVTGLLILISALWFYNRNEAIWIYNTSKTDLAYILCSLLGTVLVHIAMDNVSKIISSKFGKDKWNIDGESFMQPTKAIISPYSVNIPMLFYYKNKVRKGFIVLSNLFRALMIVGQPGSGKSFGAVIPVIKGLIANKFCMCIYDIKFPDLGQIAYHHFKLAQQQGKCLNYKFHVINLNDPEKSRRINPWKKEYLLTLADASETAEGLVEAMKKGDKSGGSDQFFTQSAINFLASCIYFFSKYHNGKFSSVPHVLAFLNCSYEEIFTTLFTNKELTSLLSPFMTAYKAKAYDQLEGQVGTLKIFISRMATKETFWIFSGDDFELKISDPAHPAVLVLANDPTTQSINSSCYSVVLNRVTKLVNSKGNLPLGIIVDEAPSLYIHKAEVLIAQARSNLVAFVFGIQSIQQLQQQYGKETAATLTSVVGNVLSGAVQNKDTLEWLERLFGKIKQVSESLSIDRSKTSISLSEKLEPLIPAGKIASLKSGEMVGLLAGDAVEEYTGQFTTSAVHCRINLDIKAIKEEEKLYRDLPAYYNFGGKKDELLLRNYNKICAEVQQIVRSFKTIPTNPVPSSMKGSMKPSTKMSL